MFYDKTNVNGLEYELKNIQFNINEKKITCTVELMSQNISRAKVHGQGFSTSEAYLNLLNNVTFTILDMEKYKDD